MAYTGTKSVGGLGTTLAIGATPTTVGEITDISMSGRMVKTDAATNLQSAAEEFIPTIFSPGSWDITFNRIGGDAGQIAMETAFDALTVSAFTVQEPKGSFTTSGPKWAFNAIVEEINYSYTADKKISGKAKLKVTGMPVLTPGS